MYVACSVQVSTKGPAMVEVRLPANVSWLAESAEAIACVLQRCARGHQSVHVFADPADGRGPPARVGRLGEE